MKICIAILCLLSAPILAQESNESGSLSFFLRYEKGEKNLSDHEEGLLLDYVYDLFLSERVVIDIRREGNSYSDDALTTHRYDYFSELCREYQLSDLTTSINIVTQRFEEDEDAHVRITYRDPSGQQKLVRQEGIFTHPDGWRAHCFASDVGYLQGTTVRIFKTPEELRDLNLLTVDDGGVRLEVFAVVSVTFVSDTIFLNPIKFQIPLHGLEEIGCKEFTLMTNATNSFPSNANKASVKREDGMMLWKLDTEKSGVYVIARRATDAQVFKFNAPEGYAILGGQATSMSPYMNVEATVANNQLSATFNNMPEADKVTCEFTLVDLDGNQYTIAAVSAKELMNDSFLSFLRKGDPVLPENLVAQKVVNK